jgi:tetratricopeptide (TPR) repeat protein
MRILLAVAAALACGTVLLAPHVLALPAQSASAPSVKSTSAPATRQERLDQAQLFMLHKQFAEAAGVYEQLLKETPKDSEVWNRLGIAYQQDLNLQQALKCYDRASKFDKSNAAVWNNMGTIYFEEQKYSRAIRSYHKAIDLDKSNATFYSNLGMTYLSTKRLPEAQEAFHQALLIDPDVFSQNGHNGTVLQDRSVSDHGLFYFLLARSFAADGNAERCVYYLRKSRDEGYADVMAAKTDPAFARVLNDPSFRDLVGLPALPAEKPKSQG